jgi:hypothetical protein
MIALAVGQTVTLELAFVSVTVTGAEVIEL